MDLHADMGRMEINTIVEHLFGEKQELKDGLIGMRKCGDLYFNYEVNDTRWFISNFWAKDLDPRWGPVG